MRPKALKGDADVEHRPAATEGAAAVEFAFAVGVGVVHHAILGVDREPVDLMIVPVPRVVQPAVTVGAIGVEQLVEDHPRDVEVAIPVVAIAMTALVVPIAVVAIAVVPVIAIVAIAVPVVPVIAMVVPVIAMVVPVIAAMSIVAIRPIVVMPPGVLVTVLSMKVAIATMIFISVVVTITVAVAAPIVGERRS